MAVYRGECCQRFRQSRFFSKIPDQEYSQRNTYGCADLPYPVQTVMALMTISPSLNEQFMILLTLAVVTNLIPFFLSIGSLPRIMRLAGCEGRERILANMAVVIASVYSLYACYASGSDAMVYGSLLTFAGWVIYGMMDRNDRQTIE